MLRLSHFIGLTRVDVGRLAISYSKTKHYFVFVFVLLINVCIYYTTTSCNCELNVSMTPRHIDALRRSSDATTAVDVAIETRCRRGGGGAVAEGCRAKDVGQSSQPSSSTSWSSLETADSKTIGMDGNRLHGRLAGAPCSCAPDQRCRWSMPVVVRMPQRETPLGRREPGKRSRVAGLCISLKSVVGCDDKTAL